MFIGKNFKDLYKEITLFLDVVYDENESKSIALLLFEHLGYTRTDLVTNNAISLSPEESEFLEQAMLRLQNHEPIQLILGKAHFYGMELAVSRSVLIPRQETEELVNLIVKKNQKENPAILDIGTGTGCIALGLKKEIPHAHVDAIDVSESALDLAMENARDLGINVHFHHLDILHEAFLPGHYDIIVSNPPYVTESEKSEISKNVLNYEPHSALFVDDSSPLEFYECIIELSCRYLHNNGMLFFEINENFGKEVRTLLTEAGFEDVEIFKDLNNKDRIASGVWLKSE